MALCIRVTSYGAVEVRLANGGLEEPDATAGGHQLDHTLLEPPDWPVDPSSPHWEAMVVMNARSPRPPSAYVT
ncbi:hypothetical protein [Mycobacterium leprae]|uniref:hypothetical protein n=1 Tax=Mycobacterium leprae TaxID=1769 RepID=UPI0012E8AC48|nr:hypothetical protein [Mycobacterium leprae]